LRPVNLPKTRALRHRTVNETVMEQHTEPGHRVTRSAAEMKASGSLSKMQVLTGKIENGQFTGSINSRACSYSVQLKNKVALMRRLH
jgi:hypothetical protein